MTDQIFRNIIDVTIRPLCDDDHCNTCFEFTQDEDPETSWMLLSEDDLISLFSQFPFDELFKHLLGICSEGDALTIPYR